MADVVPATIPAEANIYGSGHTTAPGPGGHGGGILPTVINLSVGTGRTMRLSSVSGSFDFGACCVPNVADGVVGAGTGPANDWDGIAGMIISRGRFLGAVFLDDTEPSDPPPTALSIADIAFTSISPALGQSFFVGDGLTGTGTGTQQVFNIPDDAMRLFLGLHDAGDPDTSLPGWYEDNTGSVSATVELDVAVPAPALGSAAQIALVLSLILAASLAVFVKNQRA